jgi:hypothetical protein
MRLMAWMLGDLPQDAELRKEIRIQQAMNLVRVCGALAALVDGLAPDLVMILSDINTPGMNERSGAGSRPSRTRAQVRQNSATSVRHDGAIFVCRAHPAEVGGSNAVQSGRNRG